MKNFSLKIPCHGRWVLGICLLLAGVASIPSMAAEWSLEPSVAVREEYNDNIHLTTAPHNSVWSTTLSPSVKFGGRSEILEVAGGARLNFNRYSGESGLDTNDQMFTLTSGYKLERDTWGLDASYTRDSTLASELATTGIVQVRKQRNSSNVAPSWTHIFSERGSLKLDYQLQQAKYDDAAAIGLIDYSNQSLSASLIYLLSGQDQASISAYSSKYETSPATYKSDNQGVQFGVTHAFSETLKGSVTGGVRTTRSIVQNDASYCSWLGYSFPRSFCSNESVIASGGIIVPVTVTTETRAHGSLLNATLEKQFETMALNGRLSRDVNPSGNGSLVETDRISIGLSGKLSPTLTGGLNVSTSDSRYLNGVLTTAATHYLAFEANLGWHVTEWWVMDAGYRYSRQQNPTGTLVPTSNVVYVNLNYNWPKISVSR